MPLTGMPKDALTGKAATISVKKETPYEYGGATWTLVPKQHSVETWECLSTSPRFIYKGYNNSTPRTRVVVCRTNGVEQPALDKLLDGELELRRERAEIATEEAAQVAAELAETVRATAELAALRKVAAAAELAAKDTIGETWAPVRDALAEWEKVRPR